MSLLNEPACGRKLSSYVRKKKRISEEGKKRDYIETYIPHVGIALKDLLGLKQADQEHVETLLRELLEQQRGKIENIAADNKEYDEEFAKIGQESTETDDSTETGGEQDE